MTHPRPTVTTLLERLYRDRDRLSRAEIQERAAGLDLPDPLQATVDALPDGEYDRGTADTAMRRVQREEGLWRDHGDVPLEELDQALATYAGDGQADDFTGGDAGAEDTHGGGSRPGPASAAGHPEAEPEPDSEEGRRQRPSPEGRTGPT